MRALNQMKDAVTFARLISLPAVGSNPPRTLHQPTTKVPLKCHQCRPTRETHEGVTTAKHYTWKISIQIYNIT